MKIFVSIVIYKEKIEIIEKLLNKISELSCNFRIVLIDNSPNSINNYFKHKKKNWLKYIFIGTNVGFGRGHNEAFRYVNDEDIYLILNPDIDFKTENLENFLLWFYHCNDISLAIPKVLNMDGSLQNVVRKIPTITSLIKRKLGLKTGEIKIQKNSICEIPWAHGCFMAFKTNVFKKLGGFDERFFMYMEDVDIWLRAKKYGKTVINTNFEIYHKHRKGSSKNIKLFFWHLASAVKFFLKYKQNIIIIKKGT